MANYVKFALEDGTVVYVETTDLPKGSSGLIPSGHSEAADQKAVSFDEAVSAIRKMSAAMLQNLKGEMPEQPQEVQFNFGLKASGDVGGLVVSRGGMEANFNVMVRWHAEKPEKKDEEADAGADAEDAEKEDSKESKKKEK